MAQSNKQCVNPIKSEDELQREVFRILDVFFTIGTERRVSELEDELVEFIKQYSLEQRLNELNWAKTASVWNIENRIAELKALKEER